ncbi:MAG: molybdopterin oxidoreductase family protein [Bacteroidota bacterium]
MSEKDQVHYRTCNLCEAMCGIEIRYKGNEVINIKGDKEDPFSKGYICPKAVALQDIYNDPDRLKKPMKKENGEWKTIEWKEAFALVSDKLNAIRNEYGKNAIGIYQGNPSVHNTGTMLFSTFFTRALETKNKFSATSVDQLPHHLAAQLMFGHLLLLPIPDINRTDFFLVLGGNPIASNGSIMTAAGMPNKIKELNARGGKMVVVDPRKTETAEKADWHLFIKPGKDVYLLAAMVQEMISSKLVDLSKLPEWVKLNKDEFEIFDRFKPNAVEDITGIKAEDIKKLTHEFIKADKAVCYGRMGVSVQEHGTLCQWLTNLINIISGNFDRPGGAMFPTPAIDVVKTLSKKGTLKHFGRWKSRVRELPEVGGELPVSVLAEEIETPGDGQIRAMVTSAGNPVLSTPNGTELEKSLEKLDFMVSIDIYLNETTKHADVILPPATGLENDHYDLIFSTFAVHDTAKYSKALFPKADYAKYDWEILKELTKRLDRKSGFFQKLIFRFLKPEFLLNMGLKRGPYDLNLKKLKKSVHGVDLGPLKSSMPERLFTPDKTINLIPDMFAKGLEDLNLTFPDQNGHLSLIGRRHLRSNNSWLHNSHRLVKGKNRCTAMIHPDDAQKNKVEHGEEITISSRVGKIKLEAEVTESIMPGVISIPHGWGHNRKGTDWKIAEAHAGESINDLTDNQSLDHISGNAALSGVPVEIEKG